MNQELHTTREQPGHTVRRPLMLGVSLVLLGLLNIVAVNMANTMEMKNNWPVLALIVFDFLSLICVVAYFHRRPQSGDKAVKSNEGQTTKAQREILQSKRAFWSDMFPGACLAPFLTVLTSVLILKVRPDWIVGMVTVIVLAFGFLVLVLWRHRVAMNALRRLT
ncbi:MAG TPA: hypothetical protein VF281_00030 [Candidatus Saccharimonadales bacterium]